MDNWGYIFSAYLLAFAGLLVYWLRLKRRIRSIVDGEWRKADFPKKPSAVENPQGDRR
ncbi:MAG: hypothetical protein ACK4Z6_07920 [Candidatus Methylomirabilales bacterium]